MKSSRLLQMSLLVVAILLINLVSIHAQDDVTTDRPLLMTHFMPWYQTPAVSGYWGWHWTMDYFDPDKLNADGQPEIASHYMPLTGPYDSQDEAILEYQVLLMKLSGIDGVIVDWYGIEDYNDYSVMNESTVKLFQYIKRAGLKFIICYEDHTVKDMIYEGHLDATQAHNHGHTVMQYLQDTWFTDDAYVKYQGQPLLFVYGPQYFRTAQDWDTLFSGLDPVPALVTLDKRLDFAALTTYPWPPMQFAGGIEMAQAVLESYLDLFYRNAQRRDFIVGSAFPAFFDIYEEAGVRSSYGSINPQDGDTLRMTLERALQANADLIQLVTWNDYGEGTIIEPTVEFGYEYLKIIQETRRKLSSDDFKFSSDDLELPLRLFRLRKRYADDTSMNAKLDQVFDALINGDTKSAESILVELEAL